MRVHINLSKYGDLERMVVEDMFEAGFIAEYPSVSVEEIKAFWAWKGIE